MKAAITNGALSTADSISINGHSPPISPLRTVIVMTWLGMTTRVQIQSRPRERNPIAAETINALGMPIVQYCVLSHASRRPLTA